MENIKKYLEEKAYIEGESNYPGMTAAEKAEYKSLQYKVIKLLGELKGSLTPGQKELFFQIDEAAAAEGAYIEKYMYMAGFQAGKSEA